MKMFLLERASDVSGVSGCGVVAEGVVFSSGRVALHWLSDLESTELIDSVEALEKIHGHSGTTKIKWI